MGNISALSRGAWVFQDNNKACSQNETPSNCMVPPRTWLARAVGCGWDLAARMEFRSRRKAREWDRRCPAFTHAKRQGFGGPDCTSLAEVNRAFRNATPCARRIRPAGGTFSMFHLPKIFLSTCLLPL